MPFKRSSGFAMVEVPIFFSLNVTQARSTAAGLSPAANASSAAAQIGHKIRIVFYVLRIPKYGDGLSNFGGLVLSHIVAAFAIQSHLLNTRFFAVLHILCVLGAAQRFNNLAR